MAINDRERNRHDLYVINILTAEKRLVFEDQNGYQRVFVDDDWRPRVARRETADLGYELVTIESGRAGRTLARFRFGIEADASQPIMLDKEGRMLYLVDNRGRDTAALKAIDIESGEETVLCEDPLADITITPAVSFNRRTAEPQTCTSTFGRVHRHVLDPALAADFRYLQDTLEGDIDLTGRSLDDRIWLLNVMDGGPTRYHVYDRIARRIAFLFSENTNLDKASLAHRYAEVITTRDKLALPADLYLPPWTDPDKNSRPHDPLPLLLYVHGGYWGAYPWNSWFTNRCLQLLANRGYAVLRVEFRGAGGFGRKIHEVGLRHPGGKMLEDYLDAVDWAVERGITTRDRIGIWGWSHGGHATLQALMLAPDRFACGMAMYGPTDLESFIRSGTPVSQKIWRHYFGDISSDEGRAVLQERSPLLHVDKITKPVLIVQGAKDAIVRQDHADRFVEAMSKQNKPVTYLVYPDEPHDLSRPESWMSCFAVAERFFHVHLGGRYEPVGADLPDPGMQVRHGIEQIPGLAAAREAAVHESSEIPPSVESDRQSAAAHPRQLPSPDAPATAEALDAYLAACVEHRHFSGAALVAREGNILLSKGYGLADRENDVACALRSKFRIGSITKTFTAMAIMILQDRGKLDVGDKVKKHLTDTPPAWDDVTIHYLLTHASGIRDITRVGPRYAHMVSKSMTPTERVATFRDLPLLFRPGEKSEYSNLNYILLGMIIEKVSGQHYDRFLEENIFRPLQMQNTGIDRARPILKHRARGYSCWGFQVVNTAPIDLSVPFSAGALYSTTEDLYRWAEAVSTEQLVSAKTLEQIFTPRAQVEQYPHVSFGYAWGIAKVFNLKRTLFTHLGALNGFTGVLNQFPRERLTVVVLSNCEWAPVSVMGADLGAIVLGEKRESPRAPDTVDVDAEILDSYAGEYEVDSQIFDGWVPSHYLDWPVGETAPTLSLVISRKQNRLFGRIDGQPPVELLPESQARFRCRDAPQRVTFSSNDRGKTTHLKFGTETLGLFEAKRLDKSGS